MRVALRKPRLLVVSLVLPNVNQRFLREVGRAGSRGELAQRYSPERLPISARGERAARREGGREMWSLTAEVPRDVTEA